MKVKYSNSVKKYLKDEKSIQKKYGQISDMIRTCLSVLMEVDSLNEVPNVPPTRRHKLDSNDWALDLSANWRMVIKALHGTIPEDIDEVEVVSIVDYH